MGATTPNSGFVTLRSHVELRRRRRAADYTQVGLAKRVKVTQQYISLLESGRDNGCSAEVAALIVDCLNVPMEALFESRPARCMPRVTTDTRDGRKIA
jgi:DNA-binding XRE family transcriptional regulator